MGRGQIIEKLSRGLVWKVAVLVVYIRALRPPHCACAARFKMVAVTATTACASTTSRASFPCFLSFITFFDPMDRAGTARLMYRTLSINRQSLKRIGITHFSATLPAPLFFQKFSLSGERSSRVPITFRSDEKFAQIHYLLQSKIFFHQFVYSEFV